MLEAIHNAVFYEKPEVIASAPGRVNLIGEHTDYNEGFALPIAINRRITVTASARDDDHFVLYSVDFESMESFSKYDIKFSERNFWSSYIKGVIKFLLDYGFDFPGANICIAGDIPQGIGLSSSSALEVAVAFALRHLFNLQIDDVELIILCRRAENEFVGTRGGIIDQFTSALAREGSAILIDCRTLKYEYVKIPRGLKFLILDTGVKHLLASSEQARRREECKKALILISTLNKGAS
jgi:galactokinase